MNYLLTTSYIMMNIQILLWAYRVTERILQLSETLNDRNSLETCWPTFEAKILN